MELNEGDYIHGKTKDNGLPIEGFLIITNDGNEVIVDNYVLTNCKDTSWTLYAIADIDIVRIEKQLK
jgi:hypothetical protein